MTQLYFGNVNSVRLLIEFRGASDMQCSNLHPLSLYELIAIEHTWYLNYN